MGIDEFLITTELGSMIATDALQIERGLVLVEGRRGEVQYTEVECLVLQDMVDGCRFLHGLFTDAGRNEHTVVEITFVDLPHIDQTQDYQTAHHELSTYLLILEQ